jgi:tetratricopeptide (TPR) repeat protein
MKFLGPLLILSSLLVPKLIYAEPPPPKQTTDSDDGWPGDADHLKQDEHNIIVDKATINNPTAMPPDKAVAQKDLPKEFDDIEQISDRHPDNPVAQEKITETYENVDELHRAVAHVDKYVDIERKSDDPARLDKALDARSGLLLNLGDKKAAIADATEALKLKPDDKNAQMILALAKSQGVSNIDLSKINKPEAPKSDTTEARGGSSDRGLNPHTATENVLSNADQGALASAKADGQRYIGLGDFPEAINALNTGLKKSPKNAPLLALRSQAELGEHKPGDALTDANAAVASAPKLPEAYLARAKAEEALSYPDPQIVADYTLAKDLDPRFTPDYESALARLHDSATASAAANNPNSQVDADGIGMAGRKGLGFNPQAARDQLFGGLPAPVRKFAPIAIILFMAGLILAISAWLKRQGPQ